MGLVTTWDVDPANYEAHPLHRDQDRVWPLSNCYLDAWIELLHVLELEPRAALAPTLCIDHEGDQWTFVKPSLTDLYDLYGIDVYELQLWDSPVEHVERQLVRGRPVAMETDSFFLPDIGQFGYHEAHSKTTIIVTALDRDARTLGYFHDVGYHHLAGDDFDGVFAGTGTTAASVVLPLYAETVNLDHLKQRAVADLATRSLRAFALAVSRRPADNPIARYRRRFETELPWLLEGGLTRFHRYAFAHFRQVGPAFELAAEYLLWLGQHSHLPWDDAAIPLRDVAEGFRLFQLRLARAVATGQPFEGDQYLDIAERRYEAAGESIARLVEKALPTRLPVGP